MLDNNKKTETIQVLRWRVCITGLFAGLLWGSVAAVASFFNFTKVTPYTLIFTPWTNEQWGSRWFSEMISILVISIISIFIAFVYYLFLRRLTGITPGILFGLAIWLVIFLVFSNWLPAIPRLAELDQHTLVTTLCIMIMYGVFIGYTISYDFMDQ
ncbi:YqhR family membrane protein [Amphibacillus jilinensis]|uniref:YqhR family membrane protein n=1 Tax=Amphibacillus jilinensis TaxID=1216008 RepID=UPI00030E3EDA|nr:YqhR family membrane protein [Amphibacillus jilinensis]